jgi:hypothetical protein
VRRAKIRRITSLDTLAQCCVSQNWFFLINKERLFPCGKLFVADACQNDHAKIATRKAGTGLRED